MQPKISMLTMKFSIPIAKGCLNLCRSDRCKSTDKETMQYIAFPHKLTKRKYVNSFNTEAWITAKSGIQIQQLDGCIVWNAHNTVLGEEALLIHIVPVGYAT